MTNLNEIDVTSYDVVVAYGIRISTALFKHFSEDANQGRIFRFVKRLEDGAVVVENIEP